MPVKNDRQYRNAEPMEESENYTVLGYATTFEPYEFYEDANGEMVYESFTADSFDGVNMDDVIMQYDHSGRVYARTSNDTLKLSFDEHGLKVEADLGKTGLSRQLYEDIKSGMITKMSWGFAYSKEPEFDRNTHTLIWPKGSIKKIYDVSAVSIPANNDTDINARSYCDGVIAKALEECKIAEETKKRALIRRRLLLSNLEVK